MEALSYRDLLFPELFEVLGVILVYLPAFLFVFTVFFLFYCIAFHIFSREYWCLSVWYDAQVECVFTCVTSSFRFLRPSNYVFSNGVKEFWFSDLESCERQEARILGDVE